MIKNNDKRIDLFLEYYADCYSEIPGEAFVRAGFVGSLDDAEAPMLYQELMSKPKVVKFIKKYEKDLLERRKRVMTPDERRMYLSNMVETNRLYKIDRDGAVVIKDPKHVVMAVKELNAMDAGLVADKEAPHTVIQLNLGNLDEQTLKQLDLLVK